MYTIYPNAVAAITANAQAAYDQGCNMSSTLEWLPRIQHPTDGRSALEDGGEVTQKQMELEGWFQNEILD